MKTELDRQHWRPAFSRPGFVTFKHDSVPERLPRGVFARTSSWSIGKASGTQSTDLIAQVVAALDVQIAAGAMPAIPLDRLHVWPRDRVPIGKFGFEPGPDALSAAVGSTLLPAIGGKYVRSASVNEIAVPGDSVLDLVLVDPSQWWIGWHGVPQTPSGRVATALPATWPGGVQPIEPTVSVISRAYYKAAEAIAWSGFEMAVGDLAVEVGAAPGGACGRMLELGLRVIGIDPAEIDPDIAEHPDFTHLRARAGDLPRREFRGVKWLLVDSNVRPDQTLTTVEHIVTHRESEIRGMLLTLKLGGFEHSDRIPGWIRRVRGWGASDVRVRQLARSKVEVCLAAKMGS